MRSGTTTWQSPANIALVKYWGKRGVQLPANPSLSVTLSSSFTETSVKFHPVTKRSPKVIYTYNGIPEPVFETRVMKYLAQIKAYLPYLSEFDINIDSHNTFPHSSGISSSAAFMSSLALALCQIERWLDDDFRLDETLLQKASICARMGSGSASRSVYGGMVLWGHTDLIPGSSDDFAIPVTSGIHPVFDNFQDAVLIISSARKKLSSSAGHALMDRHPYAYQRFINAENHLRTLLQVLAEGNLDTFIRLVEQEAFELHGLIMSSSEGPILLEAHTLTAIQRIRSFRESSGLHLGFSLDAGPNLHLLYPENEKEKVHKFIENELIDLCENGRWIDDAMGPGPKWIESLSLK